MEGEKSALTLYVIITGRGLVRLCDLIGRGNVRLPNHIVDTWPLTKFEGGLNLLHEADDDVGIYSDCSTREIIKLG